MGYDANQNNQGLIIGTIATEFEYSHSVFGEGFYSAKIETSRLSGTVDTIIIMASERLVDVHRSWEGIRVGVHGQYRSYFVPGEERSRLLLVFFAKELQECDFGDMNKLILDGYICKEPIYRKTPLGREIADICLAVNRAYKKSDYIPCIFWGRNAEYVGKLEVGCRIKISGRIQSREYIKKIPDKKPQKKIAYEVSAGRLEVIGRGQSKG